MVTCDAFDCEEDCAGNGVKLLARQDQVTYPVDLCNQHRIYYACCARVPLKGLRMLLSRHPWEDDYGPFIRSAREHEMRFQK